MTSSEIVDSLVVQRTEASSFSISANALNDIALFESQLNQLQKVIPVTLDQDMVTCTVIDSGTSGLTFIDNEFVETNNLPLHKTKFSWTMEKINGREIEAEILSI